MEEVTSIKVEGTSVYFVEKNLASGTTLIIVRKKGKCFVINLVM